MSAKVIIPTTDLEVLDLAKRVADRWLLEPTYTLSYMTAADFKQLVTNFEQTFNTRQSIGANRSPITIELKELDKTINQHLRYVKSYLDEKYDTLALAKSKYEQFGIEQINGTYRMSPDRNARRNALHNLLVALVSEGFGSNKYGTTFWQTISNRYDVLMAQAVQNDGNVSMQVGTKTVQKKSIRKVLSTLHAFIKLQNPDNYKGVLRSWGFQKEKS